MCRASKNQPNFQILAGQLEQCVHLHDSVTLATTSRVATLPNSRLRAPRPPLSPHTAPHILSPSCVFVLCSFCSAIPPVGSWRSSKRLARKAASRRGWEAEAPAGVKALVFFNSICIVLIIFLVPRSTTAYIILVLFFFHSSFEAIFSTNQFRKYEFSP